MTSKNKKRKIKKREFLLRRIRAIAKKKRRERRHKIRSKQEVPQFYTDVYRLLVEKKFEMYTTNRTFKIPPIFSVHDNPEKVIALIKQMFYASKIEKNTEIYFDHTNCIKMDLASSVIMDTVLLAAKTYRIQKNKQLTFSGEYADNSIKKILETSGIIKHLKATTTNPIKKHDTVIPFDMQQGRAGSKRSDKVATKLVDYFQECLKRQGYMVNKEGQNYFGKLFGEVINNAEIHGGKNSVWYTTGYYDVEAAKGRGNCQIVFLNYGDTIYERILDKQQTSKEILTLLAAMDKSHKRLYNTAWSRETLFTLLSLQEGISRLRNSKTQDNKKRGTGTIRMLECFNSLGKTVDGEQPKLDIISGHVHIKVDDRYHLQEINFNDSIWGNCTRKIIAFNKDNDIYDRADSENVSIMKESFPGTLISMNFYLDKKFIEQLKKGGN